MRGGLGLAAAGAVLVMSLAGCRSGGSSPSAASLEAQPSVTATLTWVQRDCLAAAAAMNDVAGPLERQDAAGVVAAGRLAETNGSLVNESVAQSGSDAEIPHVAEYAGAVLMQIVGMGEYAVAYEDGKTSWSLVTGEDDTLVSDFKSLESACSAAGAAIGGGDSQPAGTAAPGTAASRRPSTSSQSQASDPYSVGCPASGQLLVAWNAAPAAVRDSWISGLTPTRFTGTECWHQWVVSNPVVQANGTVIFTDTNGRLAVLPESQLSEFDAAVCGVPGIGAAWSGPAGPANCSQAG